MTRAARDRVRDILEAIDKCRLYQDLIERAEDSVVSSMALDAIKQNLQVIGEAVKHLPPSITESHTEVPWPQIRGFRNVLVHQYFDVDPAIIQDVIDTHLTTLRSALLGYVDGA
jgi:uncharacterized protein with HEPN domain